MKRPDNSRQRTAYTTLDPKDLETARGGFSFGVEREMKEPTDNNVVDDMQAIVVLC